MSIIIREVFFTSRPFEGLDFVHRVERSTLFNKNEIVLIEDFWMEDERFLYSVIDKIKIC